MLQNDQRYLVEILPIKFRSEEVFTLTSEKDYVYKKENIFLLFPATANFAGKWNKKNYIISKVEELNSKAFQNVQCLQLYSRNIF